MSVGEPVLVFAGRWYSFLVGPNYSAKQNGCMSPRFLINILKSGYPDPELKRPGISTNPLAFYPRPHSTGLPENEAGI